MTPAAHAVDYLRALAALPLVSPLATLAGRPLMVISPHPDDESLGLGGLIAAACAAQTPVTVVFLTDGERSHTGSPTYPLERLAQLRRDEARAALKALGAPADSAHFFSLGDTQLASLSPAVRIEVARRLTALALPNTLVCVTADTDPHSDHQAAAALVRDATWPRGVQVAHYPVWTWQAAPASLPTHAPKGYRVDIQDHVGSKRLAIAAHRSQHGSVIIDAVEAFALPPAFVERFVASAETLVRPA